MLLAKFALAGALMAAGTVSGHLVQDRAAVAPSQILPTFRAELNRPAPDFQLKDTDGKSWRLADLKGQVVVLEWYNPDCPVVREAHGTEGVLRTLGNRVGRMENATWLAINSGAEGQQGHGLERNKRSRGEYSIEYPVLLDETGVVGRAYGATTTPHLYIIDAAGTLVYMGGHADRKGGDLIAPAVEAALAGNRPEPGRTPNRGCSVKYPTTATLGCVAPAFELSDLNDKVYRSNELLGKIVVLEWFNPLCPVVEAAHDTGILKHQAAELTRSGQVVWMAINSGHKADPSASRTNNLEAIKKWSLGHPLLMDTSGRVGKAYDARVTPTTYVLDAHGRVWMRVHRRPRRWGAPLRQRGGDPLAEGRARRA
ncbi:MAG: redoxin domain-containing protein [Planctomycetota bacterium]